MYNLSRRNRELNLLPEIGRELSVPRSINDLSDIILRRTVEGLGAFAGHILLVDTQGGFSKIHLASSVKEDECAPELPDSAMLLAQLNETRQGILINDTRSDARWPAPSGDSSRSIIIAPIFGRSDLLGLLALAHERPGYFSQEHTFLLQAIACQVNWPDEHTVDLLITPIEGGCVATLHDISSRG